MPTTSQPKSQSTTQTSSKTASITDMARLFYSRHPDDVIYTRGQWYEYYNGVWQVIHDQTMRRLIWKLLEEIEAKNRGKPLLSKCNAVLDYLKSRYFVREEEMDANPDLINLLNGVYNLADGNLYPHKSDYYFTTQLPFAYDPRARANTWTMYLLSTFVKPRSTEHDLELAEFVQEAIGYSLTIDVSHHVTFWCVGEGSNGKGVLFHVLEQLGGSGAIALNVGLLKREQYQLAQLAGKRLALCSESNATQNLVEDALIKSLVGGDAMNVRQIRREPFTLHPTVKLWWAMNELPPVADASEGFWRRLRVIPFNRQFGKSERILDLKERLDPELPGIFIWAMQGLKRLRDRGHFVEPLQVTKTTELYRKESNPVVLFVESQCRIGHSLKVQSSSLYGVYKDWCKDNTYRPLSSRNFKREMERLGFFAKKDNVMYFTGLELRIVSWP